MKAMRHFELNEAMPGTDWGLMDPFQGFLHPSTDTATPGSPSHTDLQWGIFCKWDMKL